LPSFFFSSLGFASGFTFGCLGSLGCFFFRFEKRRH